MIAFRSRPPASNATGSVESPTITVGSPKEYAIWETRLRQFLAELGADANNFKQVDARYNYKSNRITLYRLSDPSDELSVAETISHEFLHAVLFQMGEHSAARLIDLVGKPARNSGRIGGI
jgi:hypothetical protein